MLGDDEYSRESFARRVAPDPARPELVMLTAEDVILGKLLWMRQGAGERHLADIRAIARMRRDLLDRGYLARWADRLSLTEQLDAALSPDA